MASSVRRASRCSCRCASHARSAALSAWCARQKATTAGAAGAEVGDERRDVDGREGGEDRRGAGAGGRDADDAAGEGRDAEGGDEAEDAMPDLVASRAFPKICKSACQRPSRNGSLLWTEGNPTMRGCHAAALTTDVDEAAVVVVEGPVASQPRASDPRDECVVCFEEGIVASGRACSILPCEHIFCEPCLARWTTEHVARCPLCRGEAHAVVGDGGRERFLSPFSEWNPRKAARFEWATRASGASKVAQGAKAFVRVVQSDAFLRCHGIEDGASLRVDGLSAPDDVVAFLLDRFRDERMVKVAVLAHAYPPPRAEPSVLPRCCLASGGRAECCHVL